MGAQALGHYLILRMAAEQGVEERAGLPQNLSLEWVLVPVAELLEWQSA